MATLREAATQLGVSPLTVREWVQRKGCPHTRGKGGVIILDVETVQQWRTTLRQPGRPPADDTPPQPSPTHPGGRPVDPNSSNQNFKSAQVRKWQAAAEREELSLARDKGKLIDRAESEAANIVKFRVIRNKLTALPVRVAPLVEGKPVATVEQIIETEVNAILGELGAA